MSSTPPSAILGGMERIVVHVNAGPRDGWEVVLPEGAGGVRCETLDEARRVALRAAAHARRCDLVIRDAYERVVEHELIERPGAGA
jgi:hypothetical protein